MSVTNRLAEVIRKIVREEVRSVLNEQKTNTNIVSVDEMNTGLQHALGLTDIIERRARRPKKQVNYTKNIMLNDILNETAGDLAAGKSSRLSPETAEYPLMDKTFTSNNAQAFDKKSLAKNMGYGDMNNRTLSLDEMVPKTDVRGMSNQGVQIDDAVAKALTRDYSDLVKTFKK